jgi:cation diffusion facilitator CzcD-associated flavoprotein CzcO
MQLVRAGQRDFVILERSDGIAGTWYDNRYPGAACDVPSHLYCFSFAPNPDWSRKFSPQPEIERYFQRCVETFGLGPHLRLGTEVAGARFDEAAGLWRVRTAAGEELACEVLICGTGQLNRPAIPALPGLATFAGRAFHSARWDGAHALAGRSVAVIGTGASAVQIVPAIAPVAQRLVLFQRSPGYVVQRKDRAYRRWERWMFRHVPFVRRLYRAWIYLSLDARFAAFKPGSVMARLFRWVALRNLRQSVSDPALRAKLTPDYPIGCKRILIADDYYQALVRPNVAVVTDAIERIAPGGVVTAGGVEHAVDTLIFATGFDTTSFLAPMEITGRGGESLTERWRAGAEAHLGITVAGFPNLFLLYGPNTNLGHNSILFMIECQTSYIVRCLAALDARGARSLEVRPDVMTRSNAQLQRDLARTAWAADCHNWYKLAGGKITNNWSGRTSYYWWRTRSPDLREFEITSTR